jgi:hypothetical protein
MRKLKSKLQKPETLINALKFMGAAFVFSYIVSMIIVPLLAGGFSWEHLLRVWSHWQSFNVGVLAFISSLIALNISRFNEYKRRQRQYVAAKAFLPSALSELTSYCKDCAKVMLNANSKLDIPAPLEFEVPELPHEYKAVFSKCIELAEPNVAEYLAIMLTRLQINHARMNSLHDSFAKKNGLIITWHSIASRIYDIGELQYLINSIFNYARNISTFESKEPKYDDFASAYVNLDVYPELIKGLKETTTLALENYELRLIA